MKILCWLTFLPCAAVLIAIVQMFASTVAEHSPWWIGLPLIFFFGVIVVMAGMAPVKMTSDPKVAAAILVTLFMLFEGIALANAASGLPAKELIGRLLVDIQILIGAVAGAQRSAKSTPNWKAAL